MARRTFDVVDIIEILVHWHAGRNNSEIAQSLGVDRKTTRKYVAAAQAAGMRPGGPPVSEERWAELVREWFPELADTRLRQVARGSSAAVAVGKPATTRRPARRSRMPASSCVAAAISSSTLPA